MAYNGTGTFVPLTAPNFPAVDGTVIVAAYYNAVIADLISGLNKALCRDGQAVPTANLPMGGFKLTGIGAASANGQAVEYGQYTTALAGLATQISNLLTNLTVTTSAVLPANTSIGTVSAAELAYLDGLSGNIEALFAKLASPAFTGTPTAPTAGPSTNTDQIATMAAVQLVAMNANLPGQSGNNGKYLRSNGTTATWEFAALNAPIVDRTSNTMLLQADTGKFINVTSGTFTQTFDTANFISSWCCFYKNEGTGEVTIGSSDGVSNWKMYPNELRLFIWDGAALRSEVLKTFYTTFTSSDTWVKPPGYAFINGLLWGAGGAGISARYNPAAVANYGMAGGGAGACHAFSVASSNLAATVAFTIGAGGAGVAAASLSMAPGNSGGNSTFSSFTGYGGAGGNFNGNSGGAGILSTGFLSGCGGAPLGGLYKANTPPTSADAVTSQEGGGYGGQFVTYDTGNVNYAQAFSGGSYYGGAGGTGCYGNGTNYTTVTAASNSVYGGAAGQPIIMGAASTFLSPVKGTSTFGGTGGNAARGTGTQTGVAGGIRGGGGGAAWSTDNVSATGGAGGRGELQIWGVI